MAGITAQGVPVPDEPQPEPEPVEVEPQAEVEEPEADWPPADEAGKHEAADGGEPHE